MRWRLPPFLAPPSARLLIPGSPSGHSSRDTNSRSTEKTLVRRLPIPLAAYSLGKKRYGRPGARIGLRLRSQSQLKLVRGAASGRNRPGRRLLLFYLNSGSGIDELLFDGLGLVLGDAFLDRLGSGIHQVLGFLQAQAGDFAYHFDHVDLVGARGGQDHRELGLLLDYGDRRCSATTRCRYRRGRGRRHTESLL